MRFGKVIAIVLVCLLVSSTGVWAEELSDHAFMDAVTLTLTENTQGLTPDSSGTEVTAVLSGVTGERMGSAQWFLDGVPQADYYSSEFMIFDGKTSGMEISIPFEKGMEDRTVTVALEVHLNGVICREEVQIPVRNYSDEWYDQREEERVLAMVKPMEIEAEVLYWTHTYTDKYLGTSNGSLGKGSKVVYEDHYGTRAAYIKVPGEERYCWVPYSSLRVSQKNYTVYEDFTSGDKELFVKAKGYESSTPYLVWINKERQKVNVFLQENGKWNLIRTFTCSTGANITPTPTGVVTYCAYGSGWYNSTYYVRPILYLIQERGIAMHSILFNPNGTVQDGTQGTPVSHGCVRMQKDDINWMASYLPIGTTVVIY